MPPKSSQQRRLPRAGDTFAVPLGPAGFGAVRVLRTVDDGGRTSALVAVTPYLSPQAPRRQDTEVREVLRLRRGRFGGRPAICWYEGSVPPELEHIGTVAPTEEELRFDAQGTYGGMWSVAVAHDVLRERGLPVDQVASPLTHPDIDRVTGTMDEAEFWELMELLDRKSVPHEGAVAALVARLAQLPAAKIAGFHRQLCDKLFQLDREDIARAIGAHAFGSADEFSTDHFLDARCAAVARGRDFYQSLLLDASKMIRDEEFEILTTVAEQAYRTKTGRQVVFLGAAPIETFSNPQGWSAV